MTGQSSNQAEKSYSCTIPFELEMHFLAASPTPPTPAKCIHLHRLKVSTYPLSMQCPTYGFFVWTITPKSESAVQSQFPPKQCPGPYHPCYSVQNRSLKLWRTLQKSFNIHASNTTAVTYSMTCCSAAILINLSCFFISPLGH